MLDLHSQGQCSPPGCVMTVQTPNRQRLHYLSTSLLQSRLKLLGLFLKWWSDMAGGLLALFVLPSHHLH